MNNKKVPAVIQQRIDMITESHIRAGNHTRTAFYCFECQKIYHGIKTKESDCYHCGEDQNEKKE